MTKPENPYAFPMSMADGYWQNGMPLRDWFAGLALSGIMFSHVKPEPENIAAIAYLVSDAMLAARENTGGETQSERARCLAIIMAARMGDIDSDLRSIKHRIESGDPFPADEEPSHD